MTLSPSHTSQGHVLISELAWDVVPIYACLYAATVRPYRLDGNIYVLLDCGQRGVSRFLEIEGDGWRAGGWLGRWFLGPFPSLTSFSKSIFSRRSMAQPEMIPLGRLFICTTRVVFNDCY